MHPGWAQRGDLRINGAALVMRPLQISCGHQELIDDLTPGEDQCLFEQLDPLLFRELLIFIQPGFEGAVFFL